MTNGPRVIVVGGGIAGLAAAYRVRAERPDIEVLVLEGSPRIGGKLRLVEVGGVTVDVGAEAMLNRRPEAVGLAREVGLGGDLVHPAPVGASLWSRGSLVPMPRTLMGIPADLRALDGVVSAAGLARARQDAVLPGTSLDEDVSIGHVVEERLGREIVDRLVEPLLGGVYAGHARSLSVRAAVPQVVALLERERSLVRAAAQALSASGSDIPVFAGIVGGVGRLPEAVARASGATVRTSATVRELARRAGGGWTLVVGETRDPVLEHADAVVLATPAPAAARLLGEVAPRAALELTRTDYASVAIVTLAFPAAGFPAVDGSGFLVPPVEDRAIKGATFSFAKWGWVAEAGGDLVVVRASLGRFGETRALQRADEELVALAVADLRDAIGLTTEPVDTHVQRWGGGLPQYFVGHLDRVVTVRAELARLPGLAVCGAAYDGLGIPACVASADRAAAEVLSQLPMMRGGE